MVVLDDSVLYHMASNSQFVSSFPFLSTLKNAQKSCGCSGPSIDTNAVKRQIAALDAEAKKRLKKLLNADRVRLIYRNEAGKLVQLTF